MPAVEDMAFAYYSISEAARILNVSRSVVREMVEAQKLEMVTLAPGRRPRIKGLSIVHATHGDPAAPKPKRPPKPVGDPVAFLAYVRKWGWD